MKKYLFLTVCLLGSLLLGGRLQAQCADGNYNCYVHISGTDSYGDGWNGNSITLQQGTTTLGTFTLEDGDAYEETFRVCTDNGPISLVWTMGSYAYENSFTITDSLGSVLFEGNGDEMIEGVFAIIDPCPTCPAPGTLQVEGVTDHSATAVWTELGSATEWRYYCGTSAMPTEDQWIDVTGTPTVTVTGLQGNTVYSFMVYSVCGDDDVSTIRSTTFRTDCSPNTSLPLVEDFESSYNMPLCWRLWETATVQSGYYYSTTYPYILDAYGPGNGQVSGSRAIELNSGNGDVSFISPRIPLPVNEVEVGFYIATNTPIQVGYTYSADATEAEFHPVAIVNEGSVVEENYSYTYNHEYVVLSFDTVSSVDTAYVVFRKTAPYTNDIAYIDDITIRRHNTCPIPGALQVTATGESSVALAWTGDETATYEVAYGPVGFDADNEEENIIQTNGLTATIEDLEDIVYQFYVRTVCATGNSYWSMPVLAMPNMVLMPDEGIDTITGCGFNIIDNGGLAGDYSDYSVQTMVVIPDEGMTVHLTGSYKMSYGTLSFYAGIGTDGLLINSVSTDYTPESGTIDVASEVGPMTIVFESEYNTSEGFVLHVGCDELPSCMNPYGLSVSGVAASTATVTWNYPGDMPPDAFVIIVNEGEANEQEIEVVDMESYSYTITGLAERTAYTVALVAVCGGDPSDTLRTGFITECLNGGELEIGDGTGTDNYLPTYIYYGNTLSQQLFLNSELDGDSVIYGVSFDVASGMGSTRLIDVYMDTTSLVDFSSASFVPQSADKLYFSGAVTFTDGLVTMNFTRAFDVPAGKNVLLTVSDHTNSYTQAHNFKVTSTTAPMAIYAYRDNTPFNPASPDGYIYGTNVRNNVVFSVPCGGLECIRPTVTDVVATSGSVTVTWTPGGEETAWMVEYAEPGSTEYQEAIASTTATTYTITGLEPSTTYSIRVVSLCGEATSARTVSATTLCAPESLPLVEDFADFLGDSYQLPFEPCWDRAYSPSSYSYYPYVSYDYSDPSNTYLYFGGYDGTLILPILSAPIDSLTVAFDMQCDYDYDYDLRMEFGVVDNYGTANVAYMPLDTFEIAPDQIGGWVTFVADMDGYANVTANTTGRVYFRSLAAEYTNLYFTNLNVSRLGSCRVPNNVQLSEVTPNSATLTVTDSRNAEGTTYTVYYGTNKNFVAVEDSVTFSGSSVTITDLASGTRYWAWIKSNCGNENSRVVPLDMFITVCNPFLVTEDNHYLYDFDDSFTDACMNNIVGQWQTIVSTGGDAAYSGGYSLYAAEQDADTYVATVELPVFDFSQLADGAELTFYQRIPNLPASYTNSLEVLCRTTGDEWTVIETYGATGNEWIRRYVTLPASANAAEYHLALRYTSDTVEEYSGNSFMRIDNIEVRPTPECFRPIGITLREVDNRTAVIGWNGQSDEYRVQYRAVGDWSWNTLITTADTAVVTGLVMNSDYEVRVRGNQSQLCEWSDVLRFSTTMCVDREEGYNFDAEATAGTTGEAPFNNSHSYSYSEVIVTAAQLGTISTINGIAFNVSDASAGNTMGDCQVYIGTTTLNALTEYQFNENFQLVYNGNIGFDTEGWHMITLQNPYEWDGQSNIIVAVMAYSNNYSYYGMQSEFYSHQATANRLISGYSDGPFTPEGANQLPLYAKQASNNVPDYYLVGCNPVCYEPVVVSQRTTPQSITLGILDEGYIYELQIKEHSAANWDDPVYVQDTNRYTFNNLDNMTLYDIRLRHDCTSASIGMTDWVELSIATDTACTIPTGLTLTAVDASTATFSWTPGQVENRWELHVWNDGFSRIYPSTTTSVTATGLPLGENFYAAVRARCGAQNDNVGDYSEEIAFSNICGPVANVTASNNQGTVTLQWTAGSSNTSWVVSYGYAGFSLNQQLGYVVVSTPTAVIENLPYGHKYGFRVRAVCADGWNSLWTTNEVQVNYGGVGIDGIENATVSVYPNPATDMATVCLTGVEGEVTMTIVSIEGRTVHTETFNCGSDCLKTTDISGLASGTYFVRLQAAEWNSVQKLVVK